MLDIQYRPISPDDRSWIAGFIAEHWGSNLMVSRGRSFYIEQLPGFLSYNNLETALPAGLSGLVTYQIDGDECEVTSLDSLQEGAGIGTRLLELVREAAKAAGCRRVWLITTNDNTPALRFYQRRGFRLAALYPGAVDHSRLIKPEIPFYGMGGIPIHDEIELEMLLDE